MMPAPAIALAACIPSPSERQASGRRRLADPTPCERAYDAAQLEFQRAMQAYKQSSGRLFPTWSEVLEVVRSLGYEKPAA